MSQLADLTRIVTLTPMNEEQQAQLFIDILEALEWEIDSVSNLEEATVYLKGQ